MRYLNLTPSDATRRDWRNVCEATAEFFAAFRRPREIVVTLAAAAFVAAFVIAALLSDDNCCGDVQPQRTQRAQR